MNTAFTQKEERTSFLEEKKQKTFVRLRAVLARPRAKNIVIASPCEAIHRSRDGLGKMDCFARARNDGV